MTSFKRFWQTNSAATAIEFAMIAAGIAVAIVAATTQLGTTVSDMYNGVLAALK